MEAQVLDCESARAAFNAAKIWSAGEVEIDAASMPTRELSNRLHDYMLDGTRRFLLKNICGQRYIGTRLFGTASPIDIEIIGTPGNDLGAFLSGHRIRVQGNVQDGVGNTMDDGEIIVRGRAGDVLGMSMRGGKIFVKDDVGYRTALHMKEYLDKRPILVIGGTSQDFLGEYMAGGIVILLGLGGNPHLSNHIGTGMHGGVIYLRGDISQSQLGQGVEILPLDEQDRTILDRYVGEFLDRFPETGMSKEEILAGKIVKISPVSKRPYGKIYAY